MLSDLSWIQSGMPFPPKLEKPRLDHYFFNEQLFETRHSLVLEEIFRDIARRCRKPEDHRVKTVLNYHQLLSKKTADFVCGERPRVVIENGQDEVESLLASKGFFKKLYELIIDVSRFGNGVARISGDKLTIVPPRYWFPISDPLDLKEIAYHVLAVPFDQDENGNFQHLKIEIHSRGSYEEQIYKQSGSAGFYAIGSLETTRIIETGLDDFAVQPLTNTTHSSSLFGIDDYDIVTSIIVEIIWRLFSIGKVLDKHSDPTLTGPATLMTWDEQFKTYFFDLGKYVPIGGVDEHPLAYVTWDGNLSAAYEEIKLLIDQLYIVSEMGAAFMEGSTAGGATSGTALKLRMVAPRIKAARIVNLNEDVVRNIVRLLLTVNGIAVDEQDLNLQWNDGLPNDEVEDAQRRQIETGGLPVMSQLTAIMEKGFSEEDAELELQRITGETMLRTPSMLLEPPTAYEEPEDVEG